MKLFNFKFQKIPLNLIDLEKDSFRVTYPLENPLLIESFQKGGILIPPLIFMKNERVLIIDGVKRIWFLKKVKNKNLEIKDVPCLVLEGDYREEELFFLFLELNSFRGFNLVEEANIFFYAEKRKILPEVESFFAKLGKKITPKLIELWKAVPKLIPELKELLVKELNGLSLNPSILPYLEDLSSENQKEFLDLMISLRLTFSEQRIVLERLKDLKKRFSLESLIPSELKDILLEENFNLRKKEFMEKLFALHSTDYYKSVSKIKELLSKVSQKGVNIELPPGLEKRELKVTLTLKDLSDLKEMQKFLEKKEGVLKEILNLL